MNEQESGTVQNGIAEQSLTLVELLRLRAAHQPDRSAYAFLQEGNDALSVTYAQLDRQARAIGARLQSRCKPGDRAMLLFSPGLEFLAAFFGCLYAQIIAVPANPPRRPRHLDRLRRIAADATPAVVLSTESLFASMASLLTQAPELEALYQMGADDQTDGAELAWENPLATPESLAFLQYTSGSTGTPKGVMVSHRNVIHNQRVIQSAFRHSQQSAVVGWLPLYHDMGLIGNVLQPLYVGIPCTLMSPLMFLQRPVRWLEAISRFRATTSGGPNFAYELCVDKITPEQRATLDLSCWTVAFNGAEPVRTGTLERFAQTFAECGFKREALHPCYGLAESTLLVSGGVREDGPRYLTVSKSVLEEEHRAKECVAPDGDARVLVGCGRAFLGQQIVIVHPETLVSCSAGHVGEIWVSGPSVAQGYWARGEDTQQVFQGYLSSTGAGPYLRTGDLGFLRNGEVFVTGRLKDLIIIRGRNYYPQDIEGTVEISHTALRRGCGAAFSVEKNNEEELVVVQEAETHLRGNAADVFGAIQQIVTEEYDLQVSAIVLIKPGSLQKTSSGKIQRRACRSAYLHGSLNVVAEWHASRAERNELPFGRQDHEKRYEPDAPDSKQVDVAWLLSEIAGLLGITAQGLDRERPLTYYGLDSLRAMELKSKVESRLGTIFSIDVFFPDTTIDRLAAALLEDGPMSYRKDTSWQTDRMLPVPRQQPLSRGQWALWFSHQLAPSSGAYTLSYAARIRGRLDASAFEEAWNSVVARHDVLRSTVTTHDGSPMQMFGADGSADLNTRDAACWTKEYLSAQLSTEANRPFDLERGPLLRGMLFSQSPEEHIFLLAVHHIVADLWSLEVMMRELGHFYEATIQRRRLALPDLEWNYHDYIQWQEALLASPEGERLRVYWHEQLDGILPVLNLPTDRSRPAVQTYGGAVCYLEIGLALTQRLRALSHAHNVTLYMTLLAAFQVLLYRYTGQEDLLVGSTVAGRSRQEARNLVGYFVNPVVLRADLSGAPSFTTYLARVRQKVLGALSHQDYPFPLMVDQVRSQTDASRSPVFQVMFTWENVSPPGQGLPQFALGKTTSTVEVGGLTWEPLPLLRSAAPFDLTLLMGEVEGSLVASFEYNTDLFDKTTVERMLGHLRQVMEGIVEDPEQRVGALPLLTEAERQQVVVDWNATTGQSAAELTLHAVLAAQVARTPDAVAVGEGRHVVTYAELERRANQWAHYLQHQGVGPEVRVAVCLERSMECVAVVLGVLKAGGAYVPLDPEYPAEHVAYLVSDAEAAVLVTREHWAAQGGTTGATVVCVETSADAIAEESSAPPSILVQPGNAAYVIYTSGSTGQPKGVVVSHANVVHSTAARQAYYGASVRGFLLLSSMAFDSSVAGLFGTLAQGGRVVLPTEDEVLEPRRLGALIQHHGVTHLLAIPSLYRVLLEQIPAEQLQGLRGVIVAGEACGNDVLMRHRGRLPGVKFFNEYGPTEATVWSTVHEGGGRM